LRRAWYDDCKNRSVEKTAQGQAGITLIELLVVLAIIGILAVVGVNMMGGVVSKQRLGTAAEDIKSRLRAAQLLAVVKNRPVSVAFDKANGEYYACLDSDYDGDCTDESVISPTYPNNYVNLDSGRTGSKASATVELNSFVTIYNAVFGTSAPTNVVTFKPPGGLPKPIMDGTSYVDGAVCLQVEVGSSSDDYADRYNFRRITVDAILGRMKLWRNKQGITALPQCDSQLAEADPSAIWNAVY